MKASMNVCRRKYTCIQSCGSSLRLTRAGSDLQKSRSGSASKNLIQIMNEPFRWQPGWWIRILVLCSDPDPFLKWGRIWENPPGSATLVSTQGFESECYRSDHIRPFSKPRSIKWHESSEEKNRIRISNSACIIYLSICLWSIHQSVRYIHPSPIHQSVQPQLHPTGIFQNHHPILHILALVIRKYYHKKLWYFD